MHGDDFCLAGCAADLLRVRRAIDKAFLLKDVGTLGWEKGDDKEIKILSRVVRIVAASGGKEAGISYEADPRHAELLVAMLGDKARGGAG